jgi:hypothetical protein
MRHTIIGAGTALQHQGFENLFRRNVQKLRRMDAGEVFFINFVFRDGIRNPRGVQNWASPWSRT